MSRRVLTCAVLTLTIPLAGCTAAPERPAPVTRTDLRLVAFDSCPDLVADLRKAASTSVGPYGLPGTEKFRADAPNAARTFADDEPSAAKSFSGTNTHEPDADEPDIVKTDGRRIVTVGSDKLRVVDAATRRPTGELTLDVAGPAQVLLAGDQALVLVTGGFPGRGSVDDTRMARPTPVADSELLLVDLTGPPRVVSRYRTAGRLLDARMTGGTARVVVKTTPKIDFPRTPSLTANRKAIEQAPASAWLPGWTVTENGRSTTGTMDCGRISRPTDYSGASLLSVLTFDLGQATLGSGDPVAVVADGDTVYATATSLYLANNDGWRLDRFPGRAADPQRTELFKFTVDGNRPPVYRASGQVPGTLLNQYALSEWAGHLRVATTDRKAQQSAVRVLAEQDGSLVQTGIVAGLGRGEQIYSVRYAGARGYVVTFKQTDPLYSLDLSDPARPAVTGELKITGYSGHLQPIGPDRLVGIGQEADKNGSITGTQVALFSVADPAHPKRLAQYHVPGSWSDAESNPHAVLWWPATDLLVIPVTRSEVQGALALRITDGGIKVVSDELTQPLTDGYHPFVQRTLVVGDVLWTMSEAGLMASDLSTLDRLAWLPQN